MAQTRRSQRPQPSDAEPVTPCAGPRRQLRLASSGGACYRRFAWRPRLPLWVGSNVSLRSPPSMQSFSSCQPFRVRLGALWRQVFPVATAAAVASATGRWASGQPFSLPSTLPLAVVAGVIVLGMHWLRPVRANEQGILLLRRSGGRRFLPWASISSVSFGRRLPLEPAFRIVDSSGAVLWLPRHTANLRALQLLAVQYGGDTHPLARALETPVCDAPI